MDTTKEVEIAAKILFWLKTNDCRIVTGFEPNCKLTEKNINELFAYLQIDFDDIWNAYNKLFG